MDNKLEVIISEASEIQRKEVERSIMIITSNVETWRSQADKIVVSSTEDTKAMEDARDLRVSIKKNRTNAEKIIKLKRLEVQEKMAIYSQEDKMWLKVSQYMETLTKEIEKNLEKKEKFREIVETQKRVCELTELGHPAREEEVAKMSEESYNNLVSSIKKQAKMAEMKETLHPFSELENQVNLETTEEQFNFLLNLKAQREADAEKADMLKIRSKALIELGADASVINLQTTEEQFQSLLQRAVKEKSNKEQEEELKKAEKSKKYLAWLEKNDYNKDTDSVEIVGSSYVLKRIISTREC